MPINGVRQVSASEVPPAKSRGRSRTPSAFDQQIPEAYLEWCENPEQAWFAIAYDGNDDTLDVLVRELNRAVQYAGVGRTIRGPGKDKDGNPTIWYQVHDPKRRGAGN